MEEHQGDDYPQLSFMENPNRTVTHARNLALSTLPDSVEFLVELTVTPRFRRITLNPVSKRGRRVRMKSETASLAWASGSCLQTKRRLEQR